MKSDQASRLRQIYGSPAQDEIYIDMHLTHQDIADMIGVCRQTVSSMMSNLKRLGVISSDRRSITIKSTTTLNTLLNPQLSTTTNSADDSHHAACSL